MHVCVLYRTCIIYEAIIPEYFYKPKQTPLPCIIKLVYCINRSKSSTRRCVLWSTIH